MPRLFPTSVVAPPHRLLTPRHRGSYADRVSPLPRILSERIRPLSPPRKPPKATTSGQGAEVDNALAGQSELRPASLVSTILVSIDGGV